MEKQEETVVDGEVEEVAGADASTALQTTTPTKALDNYKNITEQEMGAIETALMMGNFGALTKAQRAMVLLKKCEAIGVSIWLQPYAWGTMDGKLVPVPLKGLYQQLRARNNLTITELKEETDKEAGIFTVRCYGEVNGRKDMGIGVVGVKGLTGDPLANAMMKAHTKAKNRLTGSLCGGDSGIDDTEMSSVPGAFMGEDKPVGIRQLTPGAPGQKSQQSVTPLPRPANVFQQTSPSSMPPPNPEPPPEPEPIQRGMDPGADMGTVSYPPSAPQSVPPTTAPIKVGSSAPAAAPSAASQTKKPLIKAT